MLQYLLFKGEYGFKVGACFSSRAKETVVEACLPSPIMDSEIRVTK